MSIAAVFGATGLIGGHCVDALLAHPLFTRVHVFVRRPLEGARSQHEKLEMHVVDFERLNEVEPRRYGPLDAVFACLGTTIKTAGSRERFRRVDHDYTVMGAELARRAGATRIALVSSVGADTNAANFYLRVKGETETDVGKAGPWSTYEIFRPSLLLGDRRENRLGERMGMAVGRPLGPLLRGRLEVYRPVEARAVALAMVAAIASGEAGTHTRTYADIVRLAAR